MSAEPQPSVASLDADIIRVREEVQKLTARKSALKATVLSDASAVSRLRDVADASQRKQLDRLVADQDRKNRTDAYRLCAGATFFDPKTDGPLKDELSRPESELRNRPLLGIRLENFDQRERKFSGPSYVLLEPQDTSTQEDDDTATIDESSCEVLRIVDRPVKIFNHNLPAYVPVLGLEKYHLLQTDRKDGVSDQSNRVEMLHYKLKEFVNEIQRLLAANLRRHEVAANLNEMGGNGPQNRERPSFTVRKATASASNAHQIEIEWRGGHVGRLEIDEMGNILHADVVNTAGRHNKTAEKMILSGKNIYELGELEL